MISEETPCALMSPLLEAQDVQDNLDEDSLYAAMMAAHAKYKSPTRGSYSKVE